MKLSGLGIREPEMSKLIVTLVAAMVFLSAGFALYPLDPANAAKFCAKVVGTTSTGHPNCSFSTLDACRARVRHMGGGHCYRVH
jgi:hypothetical protein